MLSVYNFASQLEEQLDRQKAAGRSIGFVPTMGALHEGHLSLIQQSLAENNFTVCSIFVNPTQFNDKTDFELYPRHTERDELMLRNSGCHVLYLPAVDDVYPEGQYNDAGYEPKGLTDILEGAHRPGHFQGVLAVVKRLFEIVKPDKAYFGQKDYQQYLIIKDMAAHFKMGVDVVMAPTIRESSGLAMSSRNERLSKADRIEAALISKTLRVAAERIKNSDLSFKAIKELAISELEQKGNFKVDYFDICSANTLQPVNEGAVKDGLVICTAVNVSGVRLIDNLLLD